MRTGKNNSNAGFTMLELIIVIALMAILVGMFTISSSVITKRKVTSCAETIVSTMERARVLTLGKKQNEVECVLTYDGSGDCYVLLTYQGDVEVDRKEIDADNIQIQVYFDGDATGYGLSEIGPSGHAGGVAGSPTEGLFILFDRASGKFVEQTNQVAGTAKNYCNKIIVSNSSRSVEIQCVSLTGKIMTN